MNHWFLVSGFFSEEERVRRTLMDLLYMGIPRDLIDVLIAKQDEGRFFKSLKTRKPSLTAGNAGRGALVGLIVFSLFSALMIVTSGARESQRLTWIMLLGPNVGVMLGGFLGLLWGALFAKGLPSHYERLREGGGILMTVKTKSPEEARVLQERLMGFGAQSVRVDPA